jgi:hypothetical protein
MSYCLSVGLKGGNGKEKLSTDPISLTHVRYRARKLSQIIFSTNLERPFSACYFFHRPFIRRPGIIDKSKLHHFAKAATHSALLILKASSPNK